jgi:hypothetical protein
MKIKSDPCDLFSCVGLDRKKIRMLAFKSGFCKRHSGKISAPDFVVHLCLESISGTVSYNDLAARVEARTGIAASRQAYWARTAEPCLKFFQSILEHVMLAKCDPRQIQCIKRQGRFKRILLQDSTIIKLPLRLFGVFSGVKNAHAAVCNARIQGIYDLLSGRFIHFSIDPYSKNDQAATMEIPVQPGDLIVRDRGYFRIQAVEVHRRAGADSINRYKHPTVLYDPATGQKINLLELLTQSSSVDMLVSAGTGQTVVLRLIAIPVPEETGNLRRMRAKREMNYPPSRELLKLMSWTIYLTTITDPSMEFKEIAALYALRWRIENIFKTWKSFFNFQKVHNIPEIQLRVLLKARLIMITLSYQSLFVPLLRRLERTNGKIVSLIKLMRYITQNLELLPKYLCSSVLPRRILNAVIRYCTYDKRRRPNFITEMETILMTTS